MFMEHLKFLEKARQLCRAANGRLLYFCRFGSHLYGTAIPGKSDRDYKGIFLPGEESLLLEEAENHLHFSSAHANERNNAEDSDLELWSAQYWILKLLAGGNLPAIDLLFSNSFRKAVLFSDPLLERIFAVAPLLVNPGGEIEAYCLRQARKYGIAGSRCGVLKNLRKWCGHHQGSLENACLGEFLGELLKSCGDQRYCMQKDGALLLCGKTFMPQTKFAYLQERIEGLFAKNCRQILKGVTSAHIDWKAVSHAIRAIGEIGEFLESGRIVFPRPERELLLAVKEGKYSWPEAEGMILTGLAKLRPKLQACKYDVRVGREVILRLYEEEKEKPKILKNLPMF